MINPVKVCYKKFNLEGNNHFQFGIKVFLQPNALPQGQLTEVPLYFENFNIKVDGQTI